MTGPAATPDGAVADPVMGRLTVAAFPPLVCDH